MALLAQTVACSLVDEREPDVSVDRCRNVAPGSDDLRSRAGHGPVPSVGPAILGGVDQEVPVHGSSDAPAPDACAAALDEPRR
jgi:hypothetical protein